MNAQAPDDQPAQDTGQGAQDAQGLAEAAAAAARLTSDRQQVVDSVRRLAGLGPQEGPDDDHLYAGVREFARAFDYWYGRVLRDKSVAKYRSLIIARINPFVRRIELDGLDVEATAWRLVEDYNSRNFVTAGGWALEALAGAASAGVQKSPAEGIDLQRHDVATGDYHLYVLKSGLVTRNSDIVKALKRNARQAERLLRQSQGTTVHANWIVLAGKTRSTFEDGVNRPSSAEFWAAMLGLDEQRAVDAALAMAAEAGRLVRQDASEHVQALKVLVADYIADRQQPQVVDWEFLALRNMSVPAGWREQDKQRHARALAALRATGYRQDQPAEPQDGADGQGPDEDTEGPLPSSSGRST